MNKDTQEALERFEQALEEIQAEIDASQEAPEAEFEDEFQEAYGDGPEEDAPMVYRNAANHYGADIRNAASGYKAYNTDRVDGELEDFSQQVYTGQRPMPFPWVPLITATAAAVAVLYLAYRFLQVLL